MAKFLGTAALLSTLLVGGVTVHSGVLLVDVQEADGPHLVVPVPLALARAGVVLAPDEAKHLEARGFAPYAPHAERIVEALRGADDGKFLELVDGDEHVTIRKEGNLVHVRVIEGEEMAADIVVPLRSVQATLRAYDARERHFRTSGLLAALRTAPRGDLVDVQDGEDQVRIRRLF